MVAAAIGGSAAVSGITGLVGSSQAASGAQQAANTEAAATQAAINAEQSNFQIAYGVLDPYAQTGTAAEQEMELELGLYTNPATGQPAGPETNAPLGAMPSLTDITQLPGYSFTLQQGLNATNNAASAQGMAAVPGVSGNYSGAQQKGDIGYAENLANTYYNNYLANYWTNQNNRYNMLAGLVNTGAAAGGGLGNNAVNTGSAIAGTGQAGANSIAAAQEAQANAGAAGITGLGSSVSNALVANALLGNQSTSSINNASSPAYTGAPGNVGGYYTGGLGDTSAG
jgi:hypothetical protein